MIRKLYIQIFRLSRHILQIGFSHFLTLRIEPRRKPRLRPVLRHRPSHKPRLRLRLRPTPRLRHWHSSFSHSFHILLLDLDQEKGYDPDQDTDQNIVQNLDQDLNIDQRQELDQESDIGTAVFRIRFIEVS